jgi:hypothetical protein
MQWCNHKDDEEEEDKRADLISVVREQGNNSACGTPQSDFD